MSNRISLSAWLKNRGNKIRFTFLRSVIWDQKAFEVFICSSIPQEWQQFKEFRLEWGEYVFQSQERGNFTVFSISFRKKKTKKSHF